MTAAFAFARSVLHRGVGPFLVLVLVLALGLGAAIASLEAAARTDRAYPSYLQRADVGDVVVNPSLNTDRVEAIIASTPEVVSYTSDSLLTATADDGAPRTQAEVDRDGTQVRLSTDGRYEIQDRPVVHEGRMIEDGAEAFVNVELADSLGLQVGDHLPLAFWSNDYEDESGDGVNSATLEPFGRAEPLIVGIGVFPDEVLDEGLYPRRRVLVTPEVAAPFDCRPEQPEPDDDRPLEELTQVFFPAGCATSYRYYSLRVEGGAGGVGAMTDHLVASFAEASEQLPPALRAESIGFELTPTATDDERRRVQDSLGPAVRALQFFGAAAAVSTLALVLLGAARIARRDRSDVGIWRDLGATRALRTAGVVLPLAVAAGAGLAGALVVGWLASGVGPVASVRAVEPDGRLGLSGLVVLVVLGGSAVVLAGGLLLAAAWASRSDSPSAARSPRTGVVARSASPSLTLGIRAAIGAASGRALLGAGIAAVTAILATVVFSASLGGLVSNPERFGWPYDVAATINYGYGETTDSDAIATTLEHPDVRRWGQASLCCGATIGEVAMPYIAAGPGFREMELPVIEGELPVGDDEIALGTQTAAQLGLDVGDTAVIRTFFGDAEVTIRGLVVLPSIGSFLADRASLGTGALLSQQLHETLVLDSPYADLLEPDELQGALAGVPGFVAIDLRDGVDPDQFLADIEDELQTWDTNGVRPFTYPTPVRPATVANVADMRAVPIALAGVLAFAMAVGTMLAIAVAARGRRRELAVLRALGGVGRQLRATVRWQALTVVGIGLVVGIPLGVASGRVAYQSFADGLGVRPVPVVPLSWVAALAVTTIGLGVLASVGPGRRAARVPAAQTLRAS